MADTTVRGSDVDTALPGSGAGSMSIDDKVSFLSAAENYPEGPGMVSILQTHHAWLFMTDRHVYKMKKPFRRGGYDFSSLESRRRLCLEELRLNRRLAAGTYTGIVPLTRAAGGSFALGGEGEPVEWLVKMRRLPASCALPSLAGADLLTSSDVHKLVRRLARFYRSAEGCSPPGASYADGLRRTIDRWTRELHCIELEQERETVDTIAAAQGGYLEGHRKALEQRWRDGWIRDGHGDLRPQHVFLPAGGEPEIIDCLEFDATLRCLDVAAELAGFAAECGHAGFAAFAQEFAGQCKDSMPAADVPDHLWSFYASLGAFTRAALASRRIPDPAGGRCWRNRTSHYLQDAATLIESASRSAADPTPD